MSAYTSTKAAVDMMVRAAAWELGVYGIRVNSILPGYVPTDSTEGAFTPRLAADLLQRSALKRNGTPEDIGAMVVHLSQPGGWITGQVIGVDGGMTVQPMADLTDLSRRMYGDAAVDEALGLGRGGARSEPARRRRRGHRGLWPKTPVSSDYGDPSFRDGLEVFVASLQRRSRADRDRPAGSHRADPQASDEPAARRGLDRPASGASMQERIEKPIFIVGMSRSGTTALSHLLARDPANRSLLGWEAAAPVPPPEPATYTTDPRFEAAKADEFGMLHQLNPGAGEDAPRPAGHAGRMPGADDPAVRDAEPVADLSGAHLHPLGPRRPTTRRCTAGTKKCCGYCNPAGCGAGGSSRARSTRSPSKRSSAQYPDARFIVTHRDPATCVASTANMARAFGNTFAHERPGYGLRPAVGGPARRDGRLHRRLPPPPRRRAFRRRAVSRPDQRSRSRRCSASTTRSASRCRTKRWPPCARTSASPSRTVSASTNTAGTTSGWTGTISTSVSAPIANVSPNI